ncbi:50S ribosomal protein L11 methyltransferase [Elusimicrobiota bacterium]
MKINNSFFVARDTSISHCMVDTIKSLYPDNKEKLRLLDMGTGNAYIAISLFLSGYKNISATDVNPHSIKLAAKNQSCNNISFPLHRSNLFNGVDGKFDIIIFNLSPADAIISYFSFPIKNLTYAFSDNINNRLRKMWNFMKSVYYNPNFKSPRLGLINRFLEQLPSYTCENSVALVSARKYELGLFSSKVKTETIRQIDDDVLIISLKVT